MRTLAAALAITLVAALPLRAADGGIIRELKRYGRDAKELTLAPARWNRGQWARFGEGVAAVAAVYAADRRLYDAVQRNRSSFSNDFAKVVTPFGGRRALDISALMIIGGAASHNDRLRDAGRDSLESELWAAGVVTPLLKRA